MGDGVDVRPGLEDFRMDEALGWGFHALGAGDGIALEIDDEKVIRRQLGAALVDGLDQEGVLSRQADADMAAVAEGLPC